MTVNLWRLAEKSKPSPNSLQDFAPKLKDHLIPRLKAALMQDLITTDIPYVRPLNANMTVFPNDNHIDCDSAYLKGDQIYLYKLTRFQYTTYDVRRGQDIINPSTPHHNIMLLATTDDNHDHPFLYARVLGIYHANVIFTGCQSLQIHQARQFEFLWVRWYKYKGPNVQWSNLRLDRVSFPPLLPRVPLDLWTHTMCCMLVTSYPLSPMARGIRTKLGYLAARMSFKIGLGIM